MVAYLKITDLYFLLRISFSSNVRVWAVIWTKKLECYVGGSPGIHFWMHTELLFTYGSALEVNAMQVGLVEMWASCLPFTPFVSLNNGNIIRCCLSSRDRQGKWKMIIMLEIQQARCPEKRDEKGPQTIWQTRATGMELGPPGEVLCPSTVC